MELIKKSVQSVIDKDRIGSPVFLRCVLNVVCEASSLLQPTAEVVALANSWMPSQPQSVYTQGDVNATQATVMVKYAAGQMAVLSVNRVEAESAIDIMLVGNKGVIYHETPLGRHYQSATPPQICNSSELTDVIVKAFESDKPISLED